MAATTILCLFREPLPAGIVVSPTGVVAQVRVEGDDRRVAEVTVEKPKNQSFAERAASALGSALGRGDALGTVELVIPAGMVSPERLISRVLRMFLPVLSGPT